ncbi:hypothetical protein [Burkholderia gladioli]|uniref:hypothetical protein n=1 Tax=Burkholderia gladioli TaxID=28095 RepID=UPI001641B379|nr:hypothetical protein [Burkholderia gladioli]
MTFLSPVQRFARRATNRLIAGIAFRVLASTTSSIDSPLPSEGRRLTSDATTSADVATRNSIQRPVGFLPTHLRLGITSETVEAYHALVADAEEQGWTVVGVFLEEMIDELDLGPTATTVRGLNEQLRTGQFRLTEEHLVFVGPQCTAYDENDILLLVGLLNDELLLSNRLVMSPGNDDAETVVHHWIEHQTLNEVANRVARETGRAAQGRL